MPGRGAPALVGRETELAALDGLLARGRERGDVLVLHGEPGIGKSALAAVAVDRARSQGAMVLTAKGMPSEGELPFAGLHQLVAPVMGRAEHLPGTQRATLDGVLGAGDGERPVDAYRAGLAVLDLLGDIAEEQRVVVVAEDVHWLDGPTCDVLAFVARRIEADCIAMLMTSREDVPPTISAAGLPSRRLGPLTTAEADGLLRAIEPSLPAASRRRILDQAEGNPLGLIELLSEAARGADEPAMPSRLSLTTRLERTFAARSAELPPATRTALLVAALADQADVGELLQAASALAGERLSVDVFEPAVAARLVAVDDLHARFAHPLVQSALAQRASPSARQAAHAALADALAHDPPRAVWHRVGATRGTDEALAGEIAALAQGAVGRGALVTAAQLLGRAAALTSAEPERAGRLLDAGELAVEVGRDDLARRMLADAHALAAAPGDGPRRRWLERVVAERAPSRGWSTAYLDHAEHLIGGGDVMRASQALLTVAFRCWWSDVPADVRSRAVALAGALAAPAPLVETIVLSLVDPVRSGPEVAGRLDRLDPKTAPAALVRLAAVSAPVVGAFERGAVIADAAIDRLRRRGRYGLLAPALAARAWSGAFAGDWSASLAAAGDAALVSRETGQPLWTVSATAAEAALTALRGAPDEAFSLADRAEALLEPGTADGMRALVELARALAETAAGRPQDAVERFATLRDAARPWHSAFVARWTVADAADAAAQADDAGALEALVAWAATAPSPSAHLRASAAYARLVAAPDAELDTRAHEALAACPALPALRARTQLAHGSRLRRQHRTGDARATLRAARDTFEALGMGEPARRVRQELRAAGETIQLDGIDPADVLSPHELQIARMAASGMSNRDIGAALYLSHRTIGSHLYRVFPKLGIASRAQLGAVLA
jgi:DNA-binding CsgD family transcriptional regulator